jgi:hypothetical protein
MYLQRARRPAREGCVWLQIQELAVGKKLVIMINPQWTGGQVVSDFGFFGRKKKEEFVNTFKTTYSLQTKRMCGEDVRRVFQHLQHSSFVASLNERPWC